MMMFVMMMMMMSMTTLIFYIRVTMTAYAYVAPYSGSIPATIVVAGSQTPNTTTGTVITSASAARTIVLYFQIATIILSLINR